MRPTRVLYELGQSLWLDNITRELLDTGMLQHFIEEFSVTGLIDSLAIRLRDEGAAAFVKSWNDLLACIESKSARIRKAS